VSKEEGNAVAEKVSIECTNLTPLTITINQIQPNGNRSLIATLSPLESQAHEAVVGYSWEINDKYSGQLIKKLSVTDRDIYRLQITEADILSRATEPTEDVSLTITNATPYEVELFWIKSNGQEGSMGRWLPGRTTSYTTHPLDAWKVRLPETGELVSLYISSQDPSQTFKITDDFRKLLRERSAMPIKVDHWYHLSSDLMGPTYLLEGGDPDKGSFMVKTDQSGTWWRFTPLPNGTYRLTNFFVGAAYALESATGSQGCRLTPWANSPGQQWVIVPERWGIYRMYTRLTGPLYGLESNNPDNGQINDLGIRGSMMTEYRAEPGQLWTLQPKVKISSTWNDLNHDYRQMIPLDPDFNIIVQGPAFGNIPQKILFDTGSKDLLVPYSIVDAEKVTIIKEKIKKDPIGPCKQVKGDLEVLTADGTPYKLKNFTFYAAEDPNAARIMGGFPVPGAFPYELAKANPGTDIHGNPTVGYGIVSKAGRDPLLWPWDPPDLDVNADWGSKFQPYLMFKPQPHVLKQLEWAMPIPAYHGATVLFPHAVPGFNLAIEFPPNSASQGGKLHYDNLDATIDTGAPELSTRLGPDDPQRNPPFDGYFTQPGADWDNHYIDDSSIAVSGCTVTVEWIDGLGVHHSYNYLTNTSGPSSTKFIVGDFTGAVPWKLDPPQVTRTRFNLGNTIHFFWPVYYYDIAQNRIGIATQG
jgi:hypothetical protein